jgi:hypothetical protein
MNPPLNYPLEPPTELLEQSAELLLDLTGGTCGATVWAWLPSSPLRLC